MRVLHQCLLLFFILAMLAAFSKHLTGRERIDLGEGVILAMTARMEREPVSPAWFNQLPLTISAYGPLYYWFAEGAARLTGDAKDLLPGRLVSFAAGVICLLLIGVAVFRRCRRTDAALLGALLFLTSLPVIGWLPLERVDMLAIAFMLAAYVFAQKSILLAAIAIAAGSLTRQTVAFDAVPIAIWLLVVSGPGRAVKFFALAFVLTLAAWAAVIWQSNGYYLFALTATKAPLEFGKILFMVSYVLRSIVGAGAFVAVLIMVVRSPAKSLVGNVYFLAFLFHFVFDTITTGKIGATINYVLPTFAFGAILIGAEGVPLLAAVSERRSRPVLVALALIVFVPAAVLTWHFFKIPSGTPRAYPPAIQVLRSHSTRMVAADGPWLELLLKARVTPAVNDPFLLTLLWDSGRIDQAKVLKAFEDGSIGFLVLDRMPDEHYGMPERFWPLPVINAFRANYKLVYHDYRALPLQALLIYAHKSIADTLPPVPVN